MIHCLAEPHPGPYALVAQLGRPHVAGLLEQRDARLRPQPAHRAGTASSRRWRAARRRGTARRSSRRRRTSGGTCRCSCIDVHAASGAIESKSATRCSGAVASASPPVMSIRMRLAAVGEHLLVEHAVALVRRDRVLDEVARRATSAGCRSRPAACRGPSAFARAIASSSSSCCSKWRHWSPGSGRGRQVELEVPAAQLGLELRRPERVEHRGGRPARAPGRLPTRLSSTSRPVIGSSLCERVLAQHQRRARRGTAGRWRGSAAGRVD